MKSMFSALLGVLLLAGCTKQSDVTVNAGHPQPFILKNPNISVVNVSAAQTSHNEVTFKFSTEYEKNIASIEVMSGADETLFCQVYVSYKDVNSLQATNYTFIDKQPKTPATYYMIKYTTTTGAWHCSSIYKVDVK